MSRVYIYMSVPIALMCKSCGLSDNNLDYIWIKWFEVGVDCVFWYSLSTLILKALPNFPVFPSQFPVLTETVDSAPAKASGPPKVPKLPKSAARIVLPSLAVSLGLTVTMEVTLSLPEGTKLTEEAPSFWSLSAEGKNTHSRDCIHPNQSRNTVSHHAQIGCQLYERSNEYF